MNGNYRLPVIFTVFILLPGVFAYAEHHKSDAFQKTLGHLRPRASIETQESAVKQLAERILGKSRSDLFLFFVDPGIGPPDKDTFEIGKDNEGKVTITGTSGVAVSWGFHYYLRTYCNVHISWEGSQTKLPKTLPEVHIRIVSNDRFRYYQNVCTAGYSSPWWQWKQWEKNIDWMALNGINLALAFHGQEAIWMKVYTQEFNLTQDEVSEDFGGPAFLPWARMGNIRGWGGPLSASWHSHTVALQHRILQRMREFGIIPVLPAFSGQVPKGFIKRFPKGKFVKLEPWNHFEDRYCCPYLLDPADPLFQVVGKKLLDAYVKEFGTDHIYNCDTFNENEPYTTDLVTLKKFGAAIFSSMTAADPSAVWLMQAWLFYHDLEFWTESRVEALVTSVPRGKMILLDLQSEQFPQYGRLRSYFGQPFIWCMLHNFGGTLGMFGSAGIINQRVFEGRNMNGSTMIGTGLTMEGINQNYVIYELMNEMAYRKKPTNLKSWFGNYATRRYGAINEFAVEAWQRLGNTVYDFIGLEKIRGHYVITRRPSCKINVWSWYDPQHFLVTWDTFLKARHGRKNSTLYHHDVVDFTRQALQLIADNVYLDIMRDYNRRNVTSFSINSQKLLDLFDDLERILATSKDFLLGVWLEDAKSLGTNAKERELYEYNARNQITLWGPTGEIRDYANKQWSGVVKDYFKPRWSIFLKALEYSLINHKPFNQTDVNYKIFKEVEEPFTLSKKIYPVAPQDNSVDVAVEINKKWRNLGKMEEIEKHISTFS